MAAEAGQSFTSKGRAKQVTISHLGQWGGRFKVCFG